MQRLMNYEESVRLLENNKVRVADSFVCSSKQELLKLSKSLNYPVALKILSSDIIHKTDAGGVILNIKNNEELFSNYDEMIKRFESRSESVAVQEMVKGKEVLVGMKNDPQFGKVVAVATGGVFVEVLKDAVFRVAPVDVDDAKGMIAELRGYNLLLGARGEERANIEALALLIANFSRMIMKLDDVAEIDLNPVIVNKKEAKVVDVRILRSESINEVKKSKKHVAADLSMFFNPRSIAVIGASREAHKVGSGVLRNLKEGGVFKCDSCKPFPGKIYPVNPNANELEGLKCYANVKSIPGIVDLAVIAVPAKLILDVIKDCAAKKVKGVIIISADFAESGDAGRKLQDEVVSIAKKAGIRIIGPNCLGLIRPSSFLNASFAPTMPPEGNVAFISQSGALADSVIDWALETHYGFSSVVSIGNKADIDFPDLLEWFLKDDKTKVVTMYVEGVGDGARFMEAAKKFSLKKPIIMLKAGKSEAGSAAVSSHTGSLAGSYAVFKSAMKQSNVILTKSLEELFELAKVLSTQVPAKENSIAIITNAGGPGVLTADYCEKLGVGLAKLSSKVIDELEKSGKMHHAYFRTNPLDIVGDALPERYSVAIDLLLKEKNIAGLIVIQTLQTMTDPVKDAEAIINAHKHHHEKPIIAAFMGGKYSKPGVDLLEKNNIPNYNDVLKAVKAMKVLIDRGSVLKK